MMSSNPLRWGIISAGKISHDFCVALTTLPKEDHIVTHVASSNLERAKEFAETFDAERHSNNYETLLKDENVDVVYIGHLTSKHKELSILAMNYGKPVLCEKPAAVNSRDLEEVLKVAKEKNLFYMEAVWTRCFPIYNDLKSKLGSNGSLGEPNVLMGTFGIKDLLNVDRISTKEQGGSVLLDIGIYLITIIDMLFEGCKLLEMKASGFVDEATNIDQMSGIVMRFEGNKMATVLTDGFHQLGNDVTLYCSKGKVHIESPFWCSEKYTEFVGNESKDCCFPLPKATKDINFPNSEGLRFEAEHVRQCLQKGLKQSPVVSHDTTRRIMGYMDEIRRQIGCTHAL